MGEAVDKPSTPSTSEVAAAGLADDFLKFLDDPFSVLNEEDDKQGKKEGVEVKEEEEEEELEWLSNIDAFPPLDTSLTFGPIPVSDTSDALEALENVVVDEMETDEVEEGETRKFRVPKKRRSPVQRHPRQVFTNLPSQWVVENKKEKQTSVRRCTHCGVSETPQWRQGPEGPSTLCNACGVRYKSGRLCDEYRPANSPTFCPKKHSNFHRKVVEIQEGKQTDGGVNASMKCRPQSRFGGNERGGDPDDGGGLGT